MHIFDVHMNICRESKISLLEESLSSKDSQIDNLNKQLKVARESQQQKSKSEDKSQELQSQISSLQTQIQTLKDKNNVSIMYQYHISHIVCIFWQ